MSEIKMIDVAEKDKVLVPPIFISLPSELLTRIAFFLDINSFLSLKRVCRFCLTLGDTPLWEHLRLTLPPHFGASPFVAPVADDESDDDEEYLDWAQDEQSRSAECYRQGLRDKVKHIIVVANKEAWSMVRTVTMTPLDGSIHPMMLLLDYFHPYLEALHVDCTPELPFALDPMVNLFDPFLFDLNPYDFPSAFPLLSHIEIASLSIAQGNICWQLISKSPNLLSLDISFAHPSCDPFRQCPLTAEPVNTRIRQMRFWGSRRDWEQDHPAADLLLGIVKHSPELRQVVLDLLDDPVPLDREIQAALAELANLQDLQWRGSESLSGFLSLRRLLLKDADLESALDNLTDFPLLVSLYVYQENWSRSVDPESPRNPDRYPPPSRLHAFAHRFRHFPALHTIQTIPRSYSYTPVGFVSPFDQIDALERSAHPESGRISSICCGGEEVILLRLPRGWKEVDDLPYASNTNTTYPYPDFHSATYRPLPENSNHTDSRRPLRNRIYQRLAEPVICLYVDYKGKEVPSEVIEEMRVVAGGSVSDWDRRGMEVGSDVWKVLEDWYETAEEAGGIQADVGEVC